MGTVTADVGMSDAELFDSAMTDTAAQETVSEAVAQPEAQTAVPRDDKGRFAAKEADEAQAGQEAQPQAGADRREPPEFRFREVSEAKRQAEEQAKALAEQNRQLMAMLQQFQKPQAPQPEARKLDPIEALLEDPETWAKQQLDPVAEQVRQTREYFSRQLAEQRHGADKVNEAYKALDAAISSGELNRDAVLSELNNQMDPYGKIMEWHSERMLRQEIGTDPKAYQQKIIEQFFSDPANSSRIAELMRSQQGGQAQPAQAGQPSSVVVLPPSLNRQTSAASDAASDGDMSDAALFAHATRR